MDLVEVAPNSDPPVCRIMDFGKHKYAQSKRAHKSPSHRSKLKEIRVRPKTGKHDIDFKIKRARQFLEHKDKVQITVIFRGREMAHMGAGTEILRRVAEMVAEEGTVDQEPSREARNRMCMVIIPK